MYEIQFCEIINFHSAKKVKKIEAFIHKVINLKSYFKRNLLFW